MSIGRQGPTAGGPGLVLWLTFAAGFISMSNRSGFGVLYPVMAAERGWSAGEVTGAFSVSMLVYAPAVLLAGLLVDRFGVRATMLLGAVSLGAGLLAVGLVSELWQLYLAYGAAVSLGSAAVGFVPMLKMLTLRTRQRVGWGIGLFNAGQGVGALVSSPLLQLIVDNAGWPAGFGALGVAALAGLVPLVLVGAPGRAADRAAAQPPAEATAVLWRRPVFWLVFLGNGALGYLLLLPVHQVAHLAVVGLPPQQAATAGGLMGACIGLGALLGGWSADRWGAGRLAPLSAALMGLGVLALLGSGPSGLALGLVPLYILAGGFGRGGLGVSLAVLQARVFAGPSLGRVSGLLDLGFGVGAFSGPYLVALSRDLTGSYSPGLATAIAAGAVVAVCGLTAQRRMRSEG